MEEKFIKRTILPALLKHLDRPEITVMVGPRQAGKTTLMEHMEHEVKQRGWRTMTLNLDKEVEAEVTQTQQILVDAIRLEFGSQRGVLFLDEIQQKENAGRFLKGIYDMKLPYKMVVTGSGSLELKEKIHESLAGRKHLFEVWPLSFAEFAHWKTSNRYQNALEEYLRLRPAAAKSYLDEYLAFGGYPRAVLAETAEEKRQVLDEIYESYLIRDISHLLNVQKLDDMRRLMRTLAAQSGQRLNVTALAADIGLSKQTMADYLWYLEETFIIRRLTPYSRLARHEIRKQPVTYFIDLGMRNTVVGQTSSPLLDADRHLNFQNLVGNILHDVRRQAADEVHFWRTKADAEVDFIFERGQTLIPIEVKDSDINKPTLSRSYQAFLKRYAPPQGFIVNRSLDQTVTFASTQVRFVPWWKLATALL